MKRAITAFLLILILAPPAWSLTEKRLQWWIIHRENLVQSLDRETTGNSLTESYREILRKRIERAEKMISLLREARDNRLPEGVEKIRPSEKEIAAMVDASLTPTYSIAYLDLLATDSGNENNISIARSLARGRIHELTERDLDDNDIQQIMDQRFERDRWKRLAREIFTGSMMLCRQDIKKDIRAEIIKSVRGQIGRKNMEGLRELIIVTLDNELRSRSIINRLSRLDKALEKSITWYDMKQTLAHDIRYCRSIEREFASSDENETFRVCMLNREKPSNIDHYIFRRKGRAVREKSTLERESQTDSLPRLNIPAPVKGTSLVDQIDRLRSRAVQVLSLSSPPGYIGQVEKKMEEIIAHGFRENDLAFSREEEKIRSNPGVTFENMEAFRNAREKTRQAREALQAYAELSARFLDTVHRGEKGDPATMLERNRYVLKRSKEYLDFVTSLYRESLPAASLDAPLVHRRFTSATRSIVPVIQELTDRMYISRQERSVLSRDDLSRYRDLSARLTGEITSSREEIRSYYNEYHQRYARSARGREQKNVTMDRHLAIQEMVTLMESAGLYCSLYSDLRYRNEALARYRITYTRLLDEASRGELTSDHEKVLAEGSVIPVVDSFDRKRLEREARTRRKAREEALLNFERIYSLRDYYRRYGFDIPFEDLSRKISKRKAALQDTASVKLDEWNLRDSNLDHVDSRAALKIRKVLSYQLLRKDPPPSGHPASRRETLEAHGARLSYLVPPGWTRQKIETSLPRNVKERQYVSLDGSSQIELEVMPLDNRSLQEVSSLMLRMDSLKMVKTRWDKKEKTEYLWQLARGDDGRIAEIYLFTRGDVAIRVSGRTDSVHYPFLTRRLREFLHSVEH
jgi:hypothetical protein